MKIKKSVLEHIIKEAREKAPIEACGYLAGNDDYITALFPLTNTDHSPEHFTLDPAEQFTAIRQIRSQGIQLLGVFHSHPASPARPSEEDIRLANDPAFIYIIASLQGVDPVIRAFQIKEKISSPEPLDVEA